MSETELKIGDLVKVWDENPLLSGNVYHVDGFTEGEPTVLGPDGYSYVIERYSLVTPYELTGNAGMPTAQWIRNMLEAVEMLRTADEYTSALVVERNTYRAILRAVSNSGLTHVAELAGLVFEGDGT